MYGERKQKQSKMFPTKNIAREEEIKFLNKIATTDEIDNNISFEKVYNEWWDVKKTQIKITTQYSLIYPLPFQNLLSLNSPTQVLPSA